MAEQRVMTHLFVSTCVTVHERFAVKQTAWLVACFLLMDTLNLISP